jgi:hypothetical protein
MMNMTRIYVGRAGAMVLAGAVVLGLAGCEQANVNADIAVRQASQASVMASASAAHALLASGQASFAVSAVPLRASQGMALSGAVVSGAAARASINAANAPGWGPLPVTDQTVTVMPPDAALKR